MNKEKMNTTKAEFLLTLNDNIIVQRFFNIKDYNIDSYNSLEMYEEIKDIELKIHNDLKMKSIVYLLDNSIRYKKTLIS